MIDRTDHWNGRLRELWDERCGKPGADDGQGRGRHLLLQPGTSEMHFVAALDRVPGMRCVLGLFEGVVTGAADGYFRMKGTAGLDACCISAPASPTASPICTTPRSANSGIVNIVGQHAVYHIGYNAPLTSDIEGLARPMSSWVRTSPDSKSVAADGAAAIAAAKARRRRSRP